MAKNKTDFKIQIADALANYFSFPPEIEKIRDFNAILGYGSQAYDPSFDDVNKEDFQSVWLKGFDKEKALFSQWQNIYLVNQFNENHFRETLEGDEINIKNIRAFTFLYITLSDSNYSKTKLAQITRQINKLWQIPIIIYFRYSQHLSMAIIHRRPHKRQGGKSAIEKVTLIKDINLENPHLAHIDILFDLSLGQLNKSGLIDNFEKMQEAWESVLSLKELNKKFFKELSDWYFWALGQVQFPDAGLAEDSMGLYQDKDKITAHKAQHLIRLLTRVLFVWFIKEKGLIPEQIFNADFVAKYLIKKFDPFNREDKSSRYFKAILQNLFFASLNCPKEPLTSTDKRARGFRKKDNYGQNFDANYLMRYEKHFLNPQAFLDLINEYVPFLNGGLFECLDDKTNKKYIDGFSDNLPKKMHLIVPDYLFFSEDTQVDFSKEYGFSDKRTQNTTVRGLFPLLQSYKFTIAENTPVEKDIALDPELLGRVFENLLASYNPENRTTARKQTGSFYTPREIVDYMVDESLIAYLKNKLKNVSKASSSGVAQKQDAFDTLDTLDDKLHQLFSYSDDQPFTKEEEKKHIVQALDQVKILDPACGSGAFPMGALQKMVHILHKLDPDNAYWKELQVEKTKVELKEAYTKLSKAERQARIDEINEAFEANESDYGRKLYLIENAIYGVDIQPIATQISKLRFFISLIIDQKVDNTKKNFGMIALPNLETKFVAANTLIGIEKPESQGKLFANKIIEQLEQELKSIRHKIFSVKSSQSKRKHQERDQQLRAHMADLLEKDGMDHAFAQQLARWDPYNQNASSPFFDPEWMFGIDDGFDVVIGNPPYVGYNECAKQGNRLFELIKQKKILLNNYFNFNLHSIPNDPKKYAPKPNLFSFFISRGIYLLKDKGFFCNILPQTLLIAGDLDVLRFEISNKYGMHKIATFSDNVFTDRENNYENVATSSLIILLNKDATFQYVKNFNFILNNDNYLLNHFVQFPQTDYILNVKNWAFIKWSKEKSMLINKIKENTDSCAIYYDHNLSKKEFHSSFYFDKGLVFPKDKIIKKSKGIKDFFYQVSLPKNKFSVELTDKIIEKKNIRFPHGSQGEIVLTKKYKLVWRYMNFNHFYFSNKQIVVDFNHVIISSDNEDEIIYLFSLLNSKTIIYLFDSFLRLENEKSILMGIKSIKEYFRIPIVSKNNYQLKNKLIKLMKKKIIEDSAFEINFEIDQLVYQLYDLTEDEIKIIEGKFPH